MLAQVLGEFHGGEPLLAVGIARLLRLDEPFAMGLLLLGLGAGAQVHAEDRRNGQGRCRPGCRPVGDADGRHDSFLPFALPRLVTGTQVNPGQDRAAARVADPPALGRRIAHQRDGPRRFAARLARVLSLGAPVWRCWRRLS